MQLELNVAINASTPDVAPHAPKIHTTDAHQQHSNTATILTSAKVWEAEGNKTIDAQHTRQNQVKLICICL